MKEIGLFCSGYSAPEGNDILSVRVSEKGEIKTVAGIRQGNNPSFCLMHGNRLYSVSELEGEAFICACETNWMKEQAAVDGGETPMRETGKIRVPGGFLCHLYEGEKALYGSSYETGDFFAVDYDLTNVLWHRPPGVVSRQEQEADENGGPNAGRQDCAHAHWTVEWDGILYLADLGCDRIYRYRMQDGLPEEELEPLCLEKGAGPRQVLPIGERDRILSVQELDSTLRLWKRQPRQDMGEGAAVSDTGNPAMICVQKVRTTAAEGVNYPGTICMADERTVLVCNRGANTVSAFRLEEELTYIGEWPTGNWPRYITKIPGTNLIVNACNEEGVLVVFAWAQGRLEEKGRIVLHGASCTGHW